jgi:hypothetical protein
MSEGTDSAVQPIAGGQDDVNTAETNAVVRLGGGCTGTLITEDIVLTAGHCIGLPPRVTYDVVAMTSYQDRLYAATRDNNLIMREILPTWRQIGRTENDVVAMTSYQDRLYAATRDNSLWVRRISEQDEGWTRIGHANEVVAMTSNHYPDGSSMLYIITRNGKVWKRQPVDYNEDWQHVDRLAIQAGFNQSQIAAPPELVGIAATAEDRLYAATRANTLHVRYLENHWRRIGHANEVVGLAAAGDRLYAATRDNSLWVRRISEQDEGWTRIGSAGGVSTMTSATAVGGTTKLYGIRPSPSSQHPTELPNELATRVANEQDEAWTRIGHAHSIIAMTSATAVGGTTKLYATTSSVDDYELITRVTNEQDERWTRIGHAGGPGGEPDGLASVGNKLFLVTRDRQMSIRDIIETEIDWDFAEPDKYVSFHTPGRWYNLPNQFAVNFGNNSQSYTHGEDAVEYCVAGFADIMLLRLRRPVRREIAIPMRVLLRTPDSNTNPSQFWGNQQFKLVGWGYVSLTPIMEATVRQTTTAGNAVFPRQGMHGPIMMDLQNVSGTILGGDSGSPLIWNNPQDNNTNYVIAVCQGHARYFVTFSNGGTDSLGLVNPNISEWLRQFVPG